MDNLTAGLPVVASESFHQRDDGTWLNTNTGEITDAPALPAAD